MQKTILITGAAGFLGSHLCDRFIKEGMRVLAMDNLITGDLKNIEHLYKSNSATLDDFLQGSADHQRGNSKRKFWGKFNFHNLSFSRENSFLKNKVPYLYQF